MQEPDAANTHIILGERSVTPVQLLESWIEISRDEVAVPSSPERKPRSGVGTTVKTLSQMSVVERSDHLVTPLMEDSPRVGDESLPHKNFEDLSRSVPVCSYLRKPPQEELMAKYLSMLSKSVPDMHLPPPTSPPIYPSYHRGLTSTPPPLKVSVCLDPSLFSSSHNDNPKETFPGAFSNPSMSNNPSQNTETSSDDDSILRSASPLSFTSSVASALLNSELLSRDSVIDDGVSCSSLEFKKASSCSTKRLRRRKLTSSSKKVKLVDDGRSQLSVSGGGEENEERKNNVQEIPLWWIALFGTNDPKRDEFWYKTITTPTISILSFVSVSVICFGTGYYLGASNSYDAIRQSKPSPRVAAMA